MTTPTIVHGEIDQRLRSFQVAAVDNEILHLFLQRWSFDNAIQRIIVAHPRKF